MARLIKSQKIQALTNFLKAVSNNENLFIYPDEITGKTFCIAENQAGGCKANKSNFMTYEEMNCYLFGVLAVQRNSINFICNL